MKKLFLLFLLIPVPVFAIGLNDFSNLTGPGSYVNTYSGTGNVVELDISSENLNFNSTAFDYFITEAIIDVYFSDSEIYSYNYNESVDYSGVIGALSNVQPSGSTTGNQVKCTEIANFPTSGTSNHYSSCNVSLNANNLSATISTTQRNGDFEFQQINFNYYINALYANGQYGMCEYDNGHLYCMGRNSRLNKIILTTSNTNTHIAVNLTLGYRYYVGKSNSFIQQQQNEIINNTDTSSNSTDFNNTISNFNIPNDSHAFDILGGLQNFVSGLTVSSSCNRISVPIPFTNQNLVLPCMTTDVYSVHFPEIVIIWQLLVRGLTYYYIIVNILRLIKETIDPFNFKLEVMDL